MLAASELSRLREATTLRPTDGNAYLALGEVLLLDTQTPRASQAVEALAHARRLLPGDAGALFLLGLAHREASAPVDSVEALRSAVAAAPTQADTHWQLADSLEAIGQRGAAVRSLRTAISLDPRHFEAYSSLARVAAYEARSSVANATARRAFSIALRLQPAHHETLHNIGEWLSSQGEVASAALAHSRAVVVDPRSGQSHLALGEALQRQCRLGEAMVAYRAAAALMPKNPRALVHASLGGDAGDAKRAGGSGARATSETLAQTHTPPTAHAPPTAHTPPAPRPSPEKMTLELLTVDAREDPQWAITAATLLSDHGIVKIRQLVSGSLCTPLLDQINAVPLHSQGTGATTRQPYRRRHQALPMTNGASGAAADELRRHVLPIAHASLGGAGTTLECGYLTSEPGALAQNFHSDTAPAALRRCEAALIKVQLALVSVSADMGPLEVIPGSHLSPAGGVHEAGRSRPGGGRGGGRGGGAPREAPASAADAVAIEVEPGDVTLYDASVLHRGGRNSATRSRPTFQISLAGEGAAPTGIPYTVFVDDLIATLGEAT